MNKETKFTEAIAQCDRNMAKSIENNQLYEYELWKKYGEELEKIGIILEIIEL